MEMMPGDLGNLQVIYLQTSSLRLQKLLPYSEGGNSILDVRNSCSSSRRCCRRLGTSRYCHSCNSTLPTPSQKNFRLFRK
uniref:Uncharacterized protein n=1 Tax=Arundo donax TaxID=35708 RepID=A0A0A9CYR1_ARUDO